KDRVGGNEVALFYKAEDRILAPIGMLEPLVSRSVLLVRAKHKHAFSSFLPDCQAVIHEIYLSSRDRGRVRHDLVHEVEEVETEGRGIAHTKLRRIHLIGYEALHQRLALLCDSLELRGKDERIPRSLRRFASHVSSPSLAASGL